MTIKEFARLCGCNPQTLRYYDHVDLLKPAQVDPRSGYRFYEEEQALAFVTIKNLQRAGFTIEEIKGLLDREDPEIFDAFEAKIAEAERRLLEIRTIQKSYQTEMTEMQKKLVSMREMIRASMGAYDPTEEFGIDKAAYVKMIDSVNDFFEDMIGRKDDGDYGYSEYPDGDDSEEPDFLDFLNHPEYQVVYDKHGWRFVKDFFEEIPPLEEGREYALLFKLEQGKAVSAAFASTALGMLLRGYPRDPDNPRALGCNVSDSDDGQNHFWLLQRK